MLPILIERGLKPPKQGFFVAILIDLLFIGAFIACVYAEALSPRGLEPVQTRTCIN